MQSLLHSVKYSYSIITCICIFSLTGIGERERERERDGRGVKGGARITSLWKSSLIKTLQWTVVGPPSISETTGTVAGAEEAIVKHTQRVQPRTGCH